MVYYQNSSASNTRHDLQSRIYNQAGHPLNEPSQALQILQSRRISLSQTKLNNRKVIPLKLQMIGNVLLSDYAWAMV